MKSNKKLLDLYAQIYNLVAFSDCVFSYDKINELDCDGVNDCMVIGAGQLVAQIDTYVSRDQKIVVVHIDAVDDSMIDDDFNIWSHFQSVPCDAEHEIKFMFDFSNPTHRKLYNELIIALLDPHA